ncbi:uncharacterized protein LOC124170066 [Ischnura elegans]|uniref:uncharacterized protein LOC124170066 n=1 Tax=Ischnura elegans TaxID=197161 RepID=UPI001ED8B62A|nr:uncharacterized protein LOC124170066 [Ischnura elegans]
MSKRVYSGNSRTSKWRYKKKVRGLDETQTPDIADFATQQVYEEDNEVQQLLNFQNELLSAFFDRSGHQQKLEGIDNNVSEEVGSVADQGLSKDEVIESDDDEYEDCSSDENQGFSSGSGRETSEDEGTPVFEPHCFFEEKIYSGDNYGGRECRHDYVVPSALQAIILVHE